MIPIRTTLAFLCVFGVLSAKSTGAPPHAGAPFTKNPPVVDGQPDDKAWTAAKPIVLPADAGDSNKSEVRILWTLEGVYVAFQTTDKTPAFGHFKPGEPLYEEDVFEIFIDQCGDHKQFYEIQVSPAGQVFVKNHTLTAPPRLTAEGRLTPEFCNAELWRWELPVPDGLQIASRLDRKTGAWTLEMFLPASFVNRRRGGSPMQSCTWRLNLVRHNWDLPRDNPNRQVEFMYWAPVLPGHPHLSPTLMGTLTLEKP